MKKSAANSKNTVSRAEKGLKHLRLVGVGRKYVDGRLAEMQKCVGLEVSTPNASSLKTNGTKEKK